MAAKLTGATHIVDFFVGLDETETGDFGLQSRWSLRSFILRTAERLAVTTADIVLTDTRIRAARFSGRFRREFLALPVGAPDWVNSSIVHTREIDILYYGNFLPLHGVDKLVIAISEMSKRPESVVLVGDGPERRRIEELVERIGLVDIVSFRGAVAPEEINRLLSLSRVSVGIFGDSVKAKEVIANKVWQSIAAGVPTVTRESWALDEIRLSAGPLLHAVNPPSPENIARALEAALLSVPDASREKLLEAYVRSSYQTLVTALMTSATRTHQGSLSR